MAPLRRQTAAFISITHRSSRHRLISMLLTSGKAESAKVLTQNVEKDKGKKKGRRERVSRAASSLPDWFSADAFSSSRFNLTLLPSVLYTLDSAARLLLTLS